MLILQHIVQMLWIFRTARAQLSLQFALRRLIRRDFVLLFVIKSSEKRDKDRFLSSHLQNLNEASCRILLILLFYHISMRVVGKFLFVQIFR